MAWLVCDINGKVLRLDTSSNCPEDSEYVYSYPSTTLPVASRPWQEVRWDTVAGEVILFDKRTLTSAKELKWEDIKKERALKLGGTFTALGAVEFQIDLIMIPAASISAKVALDSGTPWQKVWTIADNSVLTLSAEDMLEVGRDMDLAVSSIWTRSQELRAAIESATSIQQVDNIKW